MLVENNEIYLSNYDHEYYSLAIHDTNLKDRLQKFFNKPVENAKWSKAYKEGRWDGNICFVKSIRNDCGHWVKVIKKGLIEELITFCKISKVKLNIVSDETLLKKVDKEKVKKYIDSLGIQNNIKSDIRDFQYDCIYDLLKYSFLSAEAVPASGKSLIIYISTMLMLKVKKYNTLIIVPNMALCEQLLNDFKLYNGNKYEIDKYVQIINSDYQNKDITKPIIISTWQSFQKKIDELDWVDFLVADESDLSKKRDGKYYQIITNCKNKKYSIALTGTFPYRRYADYFEFVGNTGVHRIYTTEKMLEEKGQITKVNIEVLKLNHISKDRQDYFINMNKDIQIGDYIQIRPKEFFKLNFNDYSMYNDIIGKEIQITDIKDNIYYHNNIKIPKKVVIEETDYLKELKLVTKNENRKKFIVNRLNNENKNTLVIFSKKSKEGYMLLDYFKKNLADNKILYYIDGDTKDKDSVLNLIRNDKTGNIVLLASVQVLGRGVTIKNLNSCYFVTSIKSQAVVRQVIGRIARLSEGKEIAYLYDIVDNFISKQGNFTFINNSINSYLEREKIYKERSYNINKHEIDLASI